MICEKCKKIEIDDDTILCLCEDCFQEFIEELDSEYLKMIREDKDNEKKN